MMADIGSPGRRQERSIGEAGDRVWEIVFLTKREGLKERGGSALRGHLLSVTIPFSKYQLCHLLRLGINCWELFQLSNLPLKQSASGG